MHPEISIDTRKVRGAMLLRLRKKKKWKNPFKPTIVFVDSKLARMLRKTYRLKYDHRRGGGGPPFAVTTIAVDDPIEEVLDGVSGFPMLVFSSLGAG